MLTQSLQKSIRPGLVTAIAFVTTVLASPASPTTPRIANPDLLKKSLQAAAQATAHYGLLEEHEEAARVSRIGYRLALASGFDKYPFTFGVVDVAVPNAFALPAGQIFVTRGMLDLGLTDDQLAALLGHEVAHVTKEHFLRMKKRALLLNVLTQALAVGAIAAQASSNDDYYQGGGGIIYRDSSNAADLAMAAQSASVVISELLLRSYSRGNEDESDEEGQRIAAAAGFDPDGARQLMAKMRLRIPQEKSFGYWQTHPFFDERVTAAEARGGLLKALQGPDETEVATYRQASQDLLLEFRDQVKKLDETTRRLIEATALLAWPIGAASDGIRLGRLHGLREWELSRLELSRDYGRLFTAYQNTRDTVMASDPESPLLATLEEELAELHQEAQALFPGAERVLDGGVYQVPFLEAFLSNYPDSPRMSEAALQLGLAYSRLGREADAVANLLRVWESDPEGERGQAASRGLRNLAPVLTRLAALQQLTQQERDPQLQELAAQRLDNRAPSFDDLRNGAEYLERFPDGAYFETVNNRIEELADASYREMMLYQQVGNTGKAIARASEILEYAPLTKAAQLLGRQLEEEGIER